MNEVLANVKNLREMTGAGFLDCKKALVENNNDLESSVDFLRKKGLAKANNKSSREAKEGAVGIYSNDFLTAVILINSETDFAAKNEVFLNFMDEIGALALKVEDLKLSLDNFNNKIFDGITIIDRFKNIIAKVGENIVLSRFILIKKYDNELISSYIHNNYKKNIGKIAVVLKSKVQNINEESNLLGKNLCMHIAASKPLALNMNSLDKNLIKKEKQVQLEAIKSSGKPSNILEKILEGKMKKFCSESILLNQNYILDPEKTVDDIILNFSKENKFDIIEYTLIALGS